MAINSEETRQQKTWMCHFISLLANFKLSIPIQIMVLYSHFYERCWKDIMWCNIQDSSRKYSVMVVFN